MRYARVLRCKNTRLMSTFCIVMSLGVGCSAGSSPRRTQLRIAAEGLARPGFAKEEPVTDRYHGRDVVDPYRWMETDPARLSAYVREQDSYTRAVLERLPHRGSLRADVEQSWQELVRLNVFGDTGSRIVFARVLPTDERRRVFVRDAAGERELRIEGHEDLNIDFGNRSRPA